MIGIVTVVDSREADDKSAVAAMGRAGTVAQADVPLARAMRPDVTLTIRSHGNRTNGVSDLVAQQYQSSKPDHQMSG